MTRAIETLALTGGTGFVGQAVLDEAAERGLSVRALTRRLQPPRANVEWVRGDLHDAGALGELVQGASAALHVAGAVNAPDAAGFLHANVEGTENLLTAMRRRAVSRIVHVSSLAAREPGLSDYGRSKRLSEESVQVSGFDWTIIRPPAIYGPRDTEMFELFRTAKWGLVPLPPPGRASVIHVRDLARLLLDLASPVEQASQRIFEPDDGRPDGWSHDELARTIGAAVGRKVWAPSVPEAVLHKVAWLDRKLRRDKAKFTPDRARYMSHPDWVSNDDRRVPSALWAPQIETSEGFAQTAAWYRAQGWL